jgi:hypothetical protein
LRSDRTNTKTTMMQEMQRSKQRVQSRTCSCYAESQEMTNEFNKNFTSQQVYGVNVFCSILHHNLILRCFALLTATYPTTKTIKNDRLQRMLIMYLAISKIILR